ncbi:hypothetical protein [Oceanobacillus limi]|nr:hypothetical protein [Oceanobacillus limi]
MGNNSGGFYLLKVRTYVQAAIRLAILTPCSKVNSIPTLVKPFHAALVFVKEYQVSFVKCQTGN